MKSFAIHMFWANGSIEVFPTLKNNLLLSSDFESSG